MTGNTGGVTLTTKTKSLVALGTVSIIWGTTWVASRQGVLHMPALQLAGVRQVIGGAIYISFFLFKKTRWPRGREWYIIGVLGFLNIICSNGLTTWGVKYISAGLGAIIAATFPLWIVIINLFSSRERIPVSALRGFLLGFAGICVIFYEHLGDFLNPEFLFGIAISFTASWTWALGTIFTKREVRDFNPYFSMGFQMFFGGAVLLLTSYLSGNTVPITEIPPESWAAIAYLVIFGSVIGFVTYLYSMKHLSVERMSIYAYINPVVAVVIGTWLFNEELTTFVIAGGAITLYGVYVINSALRKTTVKKIIEEEEVY